MGSIAADAVNIRAGNIDGEPTILIKRGKIQKKALKKLAINIDDLSMMLRNKNIFNITDAYYAILEPDGKLSVLKTESSNSVSKRDMKIPIKDNQCIPTEIIVDGHLVKKKI